MHILYEKGTFSQSKKVSNAFASVFFLETIENI